MAPKHIRKGTDAQVLNYLFTETKLSELAQLLARTQNSGHTGRMI